MKAYSQKTSDFNSPIFEREDTPETVTNTTGNADVPTFHDTCLRRDDRRCVITGLVDLELWHELGMPKGMMFADIEAAHIIPSAYASEVS